jgi:hypothetical protein
MNDWMLLAIFFAHIGIAYELEGIARAIRELSPPNTPQSKEPR